VLLFTVELAKEKKMNHDVLKKRISLKLKEQNQSVSNVEKLAGIGKGSLRNFLVGRTKSPTLETLYALSEILKSDLSELLEDGSYKNHEETLGRINIDLYISVVAYVKQFLLNHELNLKNKEFLEILKEIYYFSLSKEACVLDTEFAIWYLNVELKKKSA
jgi:transcriptional regulator with XRE-family HTH domain